MFVSIYHKPSLFNAHTMILIVRISMNVNKLCLNQEQRYPVQPVCVVLSCGQTMAWLPAFGIFNVHTDVDASDCTRGLYGHTSESPHWKLTRGEKFRAAPGTRTRVISVLRLVFQSDAATTELSPPLFDIILLIRSGVSGLPFAEKPNSRLTTG